MAGEPPPSVREKPGTKLAGWGHTGSGFTKAPAALDGEGEAVPGDEADNDALVFAGRDDIGGQRYSLRAGLQQVIDAGRWSKSPGVGPERWHSTRNPRAYLNTTQHASKLRVAQCRPGEERQCRLGLTEDPSSSCSLPAAF